MTETVDRILTTHAGSLPRPDDLADMMWALLEGQEVEDAALESRLETATADVVAHQRSLGIDVVNDGEFSKPGFNTYVKQRFTGFGGHAEFVADDMVDFPNLGERLFPPAAMEHNQFSTCIEPVTIRDQGAVHRDVERLKRALGDRDPSTAFMGAVSPGQIAFNFPNRYYATHEEYLGVLAGVLAEEYRAITDAGFNLQIDSPDMAMAQHCRSVGSSAEDWARHLPLAVDALNQALNGIPADRVRLHVCWGNYGGPHHKDVPFEKVVGEALRVNAGVINAEGANARHEHEWRVWRDVSLPDDRRVLVSTIDTTNNRVEHPRVIADRITRVAEIVGKERVMAGTDCGFDTIVRHAQIEPGVAWLKLQALVDGAALATDELWRAPSARR